MPTRVSILIPTHNRSDILRRTIESLSQLQIFNDVQVELVIVANACTDDTVEMVEAMAPTVPFTVHCYEEPEPGLSVARNRAVEWSTGEICAFLDDDVWVEPTWLKALVEVYEAYSAHIVAGRVDLWWEAVEPPDWISPTVESLLSRTNYGEKVIPVYQPGRMIGANFSFKRSVSGSIGGFRPDLGRTGRSLGAAEETEFFDRALSAGYRAFFAPNAAVRHWVAPERLEASYLHRAAAGRGRSQIWMKHDFGAVKATRAIVGHLMLILKHELLRWVALMRDDQTASMQHTLTRIVGQSGFTASLARLSHRNKGGLRTDHA